MLILAVKNYSFIATLPENNRGRDKRREEIRKSIVVNSRSRSGAAVIAANHITALLVHEARGIVASVNIDWRCRRLRIRLLLASSKGYLFGVVLGNNIPPTNAVLLSRTERVLESKLLLGKRSLDQFW